MNNHSKLIQPNSPRNMRTSAPVWGLANTSQLLPSERLGGSVMMIQLRNLILDMLK